MLHMPGKSPKNNSILNPLNRHKPKTILLLILPLSLLEFLTSYSTAITHLNMESFSLDRSLNRLKQVEDKLENHLASINHEYHLIKQ